MKLKTKRPTPIRWQPDKIEFIPHIIKDEQYKRTLEELAEIVYRTFASSKKPDSTLTGSNLKTSIDDASERTKSA
jgi:hypothetical protein